MWDLWTLNWNFFVFLKWSIILKTRRQRCSPAVLHPRMNFFVSNAPPLCWKPSRVRCKQNFSAATSCSVGQIFIIFAHAVNLWKRKKKTGTNLARPGFWLLFSFLPPPPGRGTKWPKEDCNADVTSWSSRVATTVTDWNDSVWCVTLSETENVWLLVCHPPVTRFQWAFFLHQHPPPICCFNIHMHIFWWL